MFDPVLTLKTIAAFFVFCLLSGGAYLINDIADKASDTQNPLKNKRPVASGRLPVGTAGTAGFLLLVLSVTAAFVLDTSFGTVAFVYLMTQGLYSLWLKKIVLIDIFTVTFSHLLRVIAGTVLIGVEISSWLLVCTILLALFLVICKRRHELVCAEQGGFALRTPADYNTALLDQMVSVVTSVTLISYCLYTISETTIRQTGTTDLRFTIPFVLYGIFRYLYLVYKRSEGCYPEEILLKDKPLLAAIGLWAVAVILFLYH
jgi:4-hydroxybenzoate polyprenyltransferase